MARRQPFKQMALPFDLAELRVPVRSALPPGLRELAEAEQLPDGEVTRLAEVWPTIRGKKPTTLAEWREFWGILTRVFGEVNDADAP